MIFMTHWGVFWSKKHNFQKDQETYFSKLNHYVAYLTELLISTSTKQIRNKIKYYSLMLAARAQRKTIS